ncbi:MAG: hypothetical protein P1U68_13965 [Verrucomicrobiales bacterium]|nr:hypothetical protein [Verrucomicrobiales bacterium]
MPGLDDIPEEFWLKLPGLSRGIIAFPRSGSRWMKLLINDLYASTVTASIDQLYAESENKEVAGTKVFAEEPRCTYDVYHLLATGVDETVLKCGDSLVVRVHSPKFSATFPEARILVTVRHPVPVVRSYIDYAIKENFLKGQEGEVAAFTSGKFYELRAFFDQIARMSNEGGERIKMIPYREGVPFHAKDLCAAIDHLRLPFGSGEAHNAVARLRQFLQKLNERDLFSYRRGGESFSPDDPLPEWASSPEAGAAIASFEKIAERLV